MNDLVKRRADTKRNTLTMKEKAFSDLVIETKNPTQSALKVYNTTDYSTAGNIASDNLKKPKVIEYINGRLESLADNMYSIAIKGKSETNRLNATKDLLDRGNVRVKDNDNVKFNIHITGEQFESLLKKYNGNADIQP
jgi:phage terminase small subunit